MRTLLIELIPVLLGVVIIYITKIFEASKLKIFAYIAVVITALGEYGVDLFDDYQSTPSVEVRMAEKIKSNEQQIFVTTTRQLESLAIEINMLGKIDNLSEENPGTDAQCKARQIYQANTQTSQSIIEFYLENVVSDKKLEYKIIYEPPTRSIEVPGTDRFKILYTWLHKGERKMQEKWIHRFTGQEVNAPAVRVWGAMYQDKPLTQADINEMYYGGTKIRYFNKCPYR